MATKDELNRQTEKRTDKKYETLDRSGIELLDKICSMTMVNWDLDEFRRTHGTLLFCIETALDSHAEAHHRSMVNSISYEDKIREIKNWMVDNEIVIIKRDK